MEKELLEKYTHKKGTLFYVNHNFFKNFCNEKQAYILGFLYADGNISNDKIRFGLIITNIDIVTKIIDALESNYSLGEEIREKGQVFYNTSITSKQLVRDLIKLGCAPNKSLILKFPTFPDYLMPHFIRGYFDGDGCVWNGKRKKMIVKDPERSSGYRERIVHNVKFTFTGCMSFIESLQQYLVKKEIVNKATKLNYSKSKNPNNNTCDRVCTMEYSGRKQMKKLYDFMYKNATIYGNTKKAKFEEIFCASEEKSSEDTSLIAGTPEMAISSEASNIEERSSTIPEMGVESSDSKCEAPNSIGEG